jgi:hypothetical protein
VALTEADLQFLEVSESKGPGGVHEFPTSVGRLHALLTRADPEERRRIERVLVRDPLPPDPERDDHNDHDEAYERGAELARRFNWSRTVIG